MDRRPGPTRVAAALTEDPGPGPPEAGQVEEDLHAAPGGASASVRVGRGLNAFPAAWLMAALGAAFDDRIGPRKAKVEGRPGVAPEVVAARDEGRKAPRVDLRPEGAVALPEVPSRHEVPKEPRPYLALRAEEGEADLKAVRGVGGQPPPEGARRHGPAGVDPDVPIAVNASRGVAEARIPARLNAGRRVAVIGVGVEARRVPPAPAPAKAPREADVAPALPALGVIRLGTAREEDPPEEVRRAAVAPPPAPIHGERERRACPAPRPDYQWRRITCCCGRAPGSLARGAPTRPPVDRRSSKNYGVRRVKARRVRPHWPARLLPPLPLRPHPVAGRHRPLVHPLLL